MFLRDLVNESVGLAQRRVGDVFANADGFKLMFADLKFYPESGAFIDEKEMRLAIDNVAKDIGVSADALVWSNSPRGSLAFGIAHFTGEDGRDYYVGRYFKSISPVRTDNRFPNDLPGGFRLQTGAARKERSGYKPTDVLTRLNDLTPDDIAAQIESKFGIGSDEAKAVRLFMAAESFPVTVPAGQMNFAAFTNYFCEMLQPMALVLGKPTTGNADEAESIYFGTQGYTTCKITFGAGKTAGLVDSTLTNPEGKEIGLSSKAKAGAKASARNLLDKVDELKGTDAGRDLLSQYPEAIRVLETVSLGYDEGPLTLAVEFGIISEEEKQQVKSLRKLGPQNIIGTGRISSNLEKLYQQRKTKDPAAAVPFYHLLAAVAYRVADYVNDKTDFGAAASSILNHGAFIQVYTNARQKGTDIVLDKFEVKYPSEAITGVRLSAEKTYYSTGNKGNFTFQILKNGATPADVADEAPAKIAAEPAKVAPVKTTSQPRALK